MEPVDLSVAVEPVARGNGLSVLAADLVFAWPCSVQRTGGISRNITGDLEFDGRTLLSLGLKLLALYVRMTTTRAQQIDWKTYALFVRPVVIVIWSCADTQL